VVAGIAGPVIAADQVTKSLAVSHLHRPLHLWGSWGFALRYNSGSAFSLFSDHAPVLTVLAIVLVAALLVAAWRVTSMSLTVGIALVLGGAVGNVADRMFRGHHGDVVDFITAPHWPTFNVADSAITVGVCVVIVTLLLHDPAASNV
jgi:signal peptidase II